MAESVWDVFISYSRRDAEICNQVVSLLSNAGISCWIDRDGIDGGFAWAQTIGAAINGAKLVLLVATETSLSSDQVYKEIDLAAAKKKKILPMEVESFPDGYPLEYHIHSLQRIIFPRQATDDQIAAMVTSVSRALGRTGVVVNTTVPLSGNMDRSHKAADTDADAALVRFKNEVRQALESDGDISPNDQRYLVEIGTQEGLSADQALAIIKEVLESEQAYLQVIREVLEDGKISSIEQKILSSKADALGISPTRASLLLEQELKSLPSKTAESSVGVLPNGHDAAEPDDGDDLDWGDSDDETPWEYFALGNMTVGQVLESPKSEDLAGYIAFYATEDEEDTAPILAQLKAASPSALVKDVVENYADFLDADTVGEFSVSDARTWSLGRVIKKLVEGLSLDEVGGVLEGTHGKTKVWKAFVEYWPDTDLGDELPDELLNWDYHALGEMKAGEVMAHSEVGHIIKGIAIFAQKSDQTVRKYLKKSSPEGLVKDVVKNYRDILDPETLASNNVATARDLELEKVIAQVFGIDDLAEITKILSETHGRTLLGKAFSGHWPK